MNTETQKLKKGHTYRVRKAGDPWNRCQVAVTLVSEKGDAACARWSQLGTMLRSPTKSPLRKRMVLRRYACGELVHIDL